MRNILKKLSLPVAAFMVLGLLFSGCGKSTDQGAASKTGNSTQSTQQPASSASAATETTSAADTAKSGFVHPKVDTSKAVELSMYLIGDGAPGVDEVYKEVNNKLKKDINATIEPIFLSWGDWSNKYKLLLSSGEEYDLLFAATWTDFADNARKGAYMEITDDMLNKYAPNTAAYPKEVLDSGRIDGKLYGLPAYKEEFYTLNYVIRGDFMKKYNVNDIKTLDDFGAYLDVVAKSEKGIIPFNTTADNYSLGGIYLNTLNMSSQNMSAVMFNMDDPKQIAFNYLETKEALAYFKKMREWNQKGYWSKNALSNKTSEKDSFLAGTSASCIVNLSDANAIYTQTKTQHPEWDVKVFNAINQNSASMAPYMVNGMALNANSGNAERALMMLDLFKNDEEYSVLTHYGIKDKHYTVNADGSIASVADNQYPPDQACPWGWNNKVLTKVLSSGLPNYSEILNEYQKNYKPNPLQNFTLDTTNAQISAIAPTFIDLFDQYGRALNLGFFDNVEKFVSEENSKIKSNNYEKYIKEVQKQVDEYLSKNK